MLTPVFPFPLAGSSAGYSANYCVARFRLKFSNYLFASNWNWVGKKSQKNDFVFFSHDADFVGGESSNKCTSSNLQTN